ncbi:MAG TPA: winged helix-turn-helix domain-containing protein [Candidatus Limnocylindrales bacterium]|nr:winged helix-turn-helix domain-containing protein [Candidatus Limnocylindrales bacterium]
MVQPGLNGTTRFGVFELDRRSGELRKAGSRIRLQIQPLKVLTALLEEPGAVVTRDELKHRIWPEESFGDFDHAVNVAVAKLRAALADSADTPRFIETLPRRGYRFIYPVDLPTHASDHRADPSPAHPLTTTSKMSRTARVVIAATVSATIASGAFAWWLHSRKPHMLTDKDTVVLADISNSTGDSVFDGTLRQGLSVQLEQSPFLSLISDERIRQTLSLMGQEPDARLTPEIARELCQRTGSAGVLDGSIAKLGNQYVLGLKAVSCDSGDVLAEEQATADSKELVLKSLADASSKLRWRLGESLGTVKKFSAPVEQVTTPSLEALQAYSLGRTTMIDKEDHLAAVPLFQRAIDLDPNFAMAYASMGMAYFQLSEKQRLGYFRTAYDLRDRVSERERFYIEAHYHEYVTGDWEKAREVYELWAQTYPRDDVAHLNLSVLYLHLGEFEKAHAQASESLRLLPGDCISYGAVAASLLSAGRLDEGRAVIAEAHAKKLDCLHLNYTMYRLAFLRGDTAGMDQQSDLSVGRHVVGLLPLQARTAAYYGQLKRARDLFREAINLAGESKRPELAALLEVQEAESEALIGSADAARNLTGAGLALSNGSDTQGPAALILALTGDSGRAQSLIDDLAARFPRSTLIQANYLPAARAQIALNRKEPSKAIETLQASTAYELGDMEDVNAGYTVYLRAQAYLAAHQEAKASAEFQKILDHPGIVLNDPIAALARVGLARAYVAQGDIAKAKAAYGDFFSLWKNADPDLPVYQQAKAEFANFR